MLLKRWLSLSLCLAVSCVFVASLTGAQGGDEAKLEWKAFNDKDKSFYQELKSKTTQSMKVQGQEIIQDQNQTFLIKWTAKNKDEKGWTAEQQIEGVKLDIDIGGNKIKYDSTEPNPPNNPMTDFFKAMLGMQLTYTVKAADMSVDKIDGREEFVKKLAGTNPQMEPLLKNILSEAALKQMAEPTWGILDKGDATRKKGDTWNSKRTLDLGAIGTYETTYTYTLDSVADKIANIKITANLTYQAPKGPQGGLPFQIKSAELSSKEGTGTAKFNLEKGRFDEVNMKMKLTGKLTIVVSTQETEVQLDQTQEAISRTFDQKPTEWDKGGAPAAAKKDDQTKK